MEQSNERLRHIRSAATSIVAAVLAAFGIWTYFFNDNDAFARGTPATGTEHIAANGQSADTGEKTTAEPKQDHE